MVEATKYEGQLVDRQLNYLAAVSITVCTLAASISFWTQTESERRRYDVALEGVRNLADGDGDGETTLAEEDVPFIVEGR